MVEEWGGEKENLFRKLSEERKKTKKKEEIVVEDDEGHYGR